MNAGTGFVALGVPLPHPDSLRVIKVPIGPADIFREQPAASEPGRVPLRGTAAENQSRGRCMLQMDDSEAVDHDDAIGIRFIEVKSGGGARSACV